MRWLVLAVLLCGCAAKTIAPVAVRHTHRPVVEADPMASEARHISNEVVRRALTGGMPADQVDRMTDLTVAMQAAVTRAKHHPTTANRRAAHQASEALREFMKGTK